MMINGLEYLTQYVHIWGFLLIFIFMAVESSFIPFPSEVVMIPAGFWAMRGELIFGVWYIDVIAALVAGTAGAMAGAYLNYYIALKLGRKLLYKYCRYFLLKPEFLERSEELFREYGELTTFVCRLLPTIRQLISLPAGLARMNLRSFSLFTALGAGIWNLILLAIGVYLGHLSGSMSYDELFARSKKLLSENYVWLFVALAVLIMLYIAVHQLVMRRGRGR